MQNWNVLNETFLLGNKLKFSQCFYIDLQTLAKTPRIAGNAVFDMDNDNLVRSKSCQIKGFQKTGM